MDEIKIGSVVFQDVTVYSQTNKIRNRKKYQADILGMTIVVSNMINEGKMTFRCEGIGIRNTNFVSPDITFERACAAACQNVIKKLELILQNLK